MPSTNEKVASAVFYRTSSGREPVRDWLLEHDKADRKAIGADIQTIEFCWPIGMPLCRPMGGGLYEVRTTLDSRIARVLFCFNNDKIVLLHGFIKKSKKIPVSDLDIARNRRREVDNETK